MAHYAFLNDSNIVTEVITGINEFDLIEGLNPEIWYGNFRNQKCIRTSYSSSIRYNFAAIGFSYDPVDDAFIPPIPQCGHPELQLNELKRWECSICNDQIQQRLASFKEQS